MYNSILNKTPLGPFPHNLILVILVELCLELSYGVIY